MLEDVGAEAAEAWLLRGPPTSLARNADRLEAMRTSSVGGPLHPPRELARSPRARRQLIRFAGGKRPKPFALCGTHGRRGSAESTRPPRPGRISPLTPCACFTPGQTSLAVHGVGVSRGSVDKKARLGYLKEITVEINFIAPATATFAGQ